MRSRTYKLVSLGLAFVGAIAIWIIATQIFPYHSLNHDEAVYLQQASMLLEGQLNLWPPLDGALRPWFFIEDGGRLYPKYSPVPAAMFAVGKLAGASRLALVGIAAANVVLVVGIVREVFDRATGVVAGVFVLISPLFLIDSSVFLPYAPTTMLNLLFAYGYFRIDRTGDRRWAVVAGTAVGLAFFARPFTAVLFATPFVIHALWFLFTDWPRTLERNAIIAMLGFAGVGTALLYNALMTGSPWLFPYEAFAPLDGIGFGRREILGHGTTYTPALAITANRKILELFVTEWIAGGILGAGFAILGLVRSVHSHPSKRKAVVAGLFLTIIVGNVYFWGNLNILGDIGRAGDGLVSAIGPYYHFDLLLPTAAFAAAGVLWVGQALYSVLDGHLDRRLARTTFLIVVIANGAIIGAVTATDIGERVEENMAVTNTYEDAYEPFEGGPPEDSLILLPAPYGEWLNHPFQSLRNDPGFDGKAVYAVGDRPFEVMNEFPDRRPYRFVYRGSWAPYAGSPEAAGLQRVHHVAGSRAHLETSVGIPDGAIGVTGRLETDEGSIYYVAPAESDDLDFTLTVSDGEAQIRGDLQPLENDTIAVGDREIVRLTVFVDYGHGGGFEYRFGLPVQISDGQVHALSPRIEHCLDPRVCGGAGAYIPETAPDGVSVRSELTSSTRETEAA